MSNLPRNILLPGDKVTVAKGRNAGAVLTVEFVTAKTVAGYSGSLWLGTILKSSLSRMSIAAAQDKRRMAPIFEMANLDYNAQIARDMGKTPTELVTWLFETLSFQEVAAWLS